MPTVSISTFADALRKTHLLAAHQLDELTRDLQARFLVPHDLAAELIRRDWLTPYQANQLLQGRGGDLLLGSYVLLERIGEGGMGAVFKARNWKLGNIVALKLVRPEKLDNPDAVRRFHHEIRAAAQLDHPNIVRAFDADEVNGAHLLVMEYVPGVDLAKLVKKSGPLPVDKACDYARQAALGLQHAFERGMVHRDIKPANLLLTPAGVVKILDMGLARLRHAAEESDASSTMTREGTVMGTLDYIAPEQAIIRIGWTSAPISTAWVAHSTSCCRAKYRFRRHGDGKADETPVCRSRRRWNRCIRAYRRRWRRWCES